MRNLLDFVGNKNHLNLGDYFFSPIMEASAGIALEYCKQVVVEKDESYPMFFCFPEKKSASLWTSIAILTNFFLEDHIYNVVDGIVFRRFDKVKIYNCIAEVERITEEKIYLRFSDQGGIPINKRLKSQLSKVSSTRALSLKKRFFENHKKAKHERNAISRILVPKEPETINQNNLDSKVLLITGRGNVKKNQELLNTTKIYDEFLSKIFPEKKNLIIAPDLKFYKDFFNVDKEQELIEFKDLLNILSDNIITNDAKIILKELSSKLNNEIEISIDFENRFISFINEYKNEIPQLAHLQKKYPGYQDSLPEKLRAVVINDINQINDFPDTIKGFLKKRIPVIFISNRNIENVNEIDFYANLFNNNPKYCRINWNRKKIKALNKCTSDVDYIDAELWKQCRRYSRQKIYINVTLQNELDALTPKILQLIRTLDGFELLQKAFYSYFYPALFALKNSLKSNERVQFLILEFKNVFDEVKKNGLSQDQIKEIEKVIQIASDFGDNTKSYTFSNDIFSNVTSSKNSNIYIPVEIQKNNIPTSITEKVLFTGYPYNEYAGRFLLNSVCLDFVPNIQIICWPNEASLTERYLRRRIKAGYFSDYLNSPQLKEEYLLQNDSDFEKEIDLFLFLNRRIEVEITQEENIEYLHTFKYKGYGFQNEERQTTVKCDIINFDDGSFMFLPKQSTVLTQIEDSHGKTTISETKFNELNIGYKIFKYKKDRATYREISKNNNIIKACFEKLESWKIMLEQLSTDVNSNLDALEKYLLETKEKFNLTEGNPARSNLQRWLFDDECICPRTPNLKIILYAAKVENFDQKLIELENAFKEVNSYTIGLSSEIKKNIAKQLSSNTLSNNIFVNINGNQIKVETRTIASLDKNGIEIDYRNTRKILC